jgi:putative glutamine amidotransferase
VARPRIGLTLDLIDPIIRQVERRMRLAIEAAGGRMLIVPSSADPEAWQELYGLIDGLVMMGGMDVAPARYGHAAHPATEPAEAGADETELGLARACLRDRKPVLGICRGSQVLNVAAGGTLIQDVPTLVPDAVPHYAADWRTALETPAGSRHELRLLTGSRLAEMLDGADLVVNSYHHQCVDEVGAGLRAVAWAPDGVIEATESTNGGFALGLQWHNEFHMEHDERFARPVQALVDAAR